MGDFSLGVFCHGVFFVGGLFHHAGFFYYGIFQPILCVFFHQSGCELSPKLSYFSMPKQQAFGDFPANSSPVASSARNQRYYKVWIENCCHAFTAFNLLLQNTSGNICTVLAKLLEHHRTYHSEKFSFLKLNVSFKSETRTKQTTIEANDEQTF